LVSGEGFAKYALEVLGHSRRTETCADVGNAGFDELITASTIKEEAFKSICEGSYIIGFAEDATSGGLD
jgi:hypothetical protein